MDKKDVGEITMRLDAIIALLVGTLPNPEKRRTLREQIQLLDAAGLGQAAIARIVRRPPRAVASELARIRAKVRRRK
jgi:DNA-directed RNA polymerase specialized sigma24 family protein